MQKIKQTIFGKKYNLFVARSKNDKKKGMNIFLKQPKRTGMLFIYDVETPNRSFTLSKTPFPLLVLFLDKDQKIVYQELGKKYQKNSIVCKKPSMYVIEIPG